MDDPWTTARHAAADAAVDVRPLTSLAEADAVIRVMRATWGDAQLLPREIVRALQAAGVPPYGAFARGALVGYVLGFVGAGEDGIHVHSHMLAVLPEARGRGVGYALKLAQRAAALDAGIRLVRWTFDPLRAANARFNLVKLGAVADRFHRDFYGEMGDLQNRGDRSDRLEIRWDLDGAPRPAERHATQQVLGLEGSDDAPRPTAVRRPEGAWAAIRIPRDHPALRERDPGLARAWRDASAEAFQACIAAGMEAVSFTDDAGYVFRARG